MFRNYRAGNDPDREEKALNSAVMSGWAFVSGLLHSNAVRLRQNNTVAKGSRYPLVPTFFGFYLNVERQRTLAKIRHLMKKDPATRRTGRTDCNREAHAGWSSL